MTNTDTTTAIRPFTIEVPQADLDDLQYRLAHTRYPLEAPGDDWAYGAPVSFVKEFVDYWQHEYDWRAQEERINAFPQFTTEIDGQSSTSSTSSRRSRTRCRSSSRTAGRARSPTTWT